MEIESFDTPSEGREFRFIVLGGARPLRILVSVDDLRLVERECPDPPCHEMVFVPEGARQVSIRAVDANGDVAEELFPVKDYSKEPAPLA